MTTEDRVVERRGERRARLIRNTSGAAVGRAERHVKKPRGQEEVLL